MQAVPLNDLVVLNESHLSLKVWISDLILEGNSFKLAWDHVSYFEGILLIHIAGNKDFGIDYPVNDLLANILFLKLFNTEFFE